MFPNIQTLNRNKKILILGGTSSLAKEIIPICASNGFKITKTSRKQKLNSQINQHDLLYLDVSSIKSINLFLENINDMRFSYVLCLIGSTSEIFKYPYKNFKEINTYLNTYITNLIFLLDNLFFNYRVSNSCSILVLSSRAAKYGSQDRYYAVAKSALEGFIKSKGKFNSKRIQLNAVSLGLISGSKMQIKMSNQNVLSHEHRSKNQLLDVTNASKLIIRTLRNKKIGSGKVIYLGPQYE
jgi:short-subunit dehydrogenase